jgi:REP element-mobilizing transposase RayT
MPEHVHLLMSEPEQGNPSKALQMLKTGGLAFAAKEGKEQHQAVETVWLFGDGGATSILAAPFLRL